MLDTIYRVETPEGIALHLDAAGAWPRAAAWLIDFMIRGAIMFIAAIPAGLLGEAGGGLLLILMFVVVWLYPILFEVLRDGQTIGKRVIGLRVVHANGTPVGWLASILRNLMRTADMLPFGYGFGLMSILVDSRGRRLGDRVAGTLVVHVAESRKPMDLPAVPVVQAEQWLAVEEKAALISFAERAPRLTPARQQELAELLPVLTRARGALAVQRLLGIASGLLGRSA